MIAEQGTDAWLAARLGHVTASRFADVLTAGRSKAKPWGDTALAYAYQLAAERLTGEGEPEFSTRATEWGTELEPAAREAYEAAQGVDVETTGFLTHALVDGVGGSPDGLVGDDGLIEIKCPYTSREHVKTVYEGAMPEKHAPQVQGLLWVTARDWCDFVSYDPRMPEGCRLFLARVERDDAFIETLAERVEAFCGLVNQIVEACRGE